MKRIRSEISGLAKDIAWIAGIVFIIVGAYWLLKFLYALVVGIVTLIVVTSGIVLVAALLLWAITEMPFPTNTQREPNKTKGV